MEPVRERYLGTNRDLVRHLPDQTQVRITHEDADIARFLRRGDGRDEQQCDEQPTACGLGHGAPLPVDVLAGTTRSYERG